MTTPNPISTVIDTPLRIGAGRHGDGPWLNGWEKRYFTAAPSFRHKFAAAQPET
ncbi:MAG: hypothetical protein MUF74_08805 [Cypionkella sp.]|jgi:hypothetical protein|nr:hypothetical protein [Cypionkella sp.]